MDSLLFLACFALVALIPVTFVITGYVAYRTGKDPFAIVAAIIASLIAHFALTGLAIYPLFIIVYTAAHTPQDKRSFINPIILIFVLAYAFTGWLLCSFIYGRLLKPRGLRKNDEV